MPKIGVRYIKANWGLFLCWTGFWGILCISMNLLYNLSIHFGNDQVFFHSCYKGRFWRWHSLPCTSRVTLGSNFKSIGQRAKAVETRLWLFKIPWTLDDFFGQRRFYSMLLASSFVKRALLHVSTLFYMLALFCFSFQIFQTASPALEKSRRLLRHLWFPERHCDHGRRTILISHCFFLGGASQHGMLSP